MSDNEQGKNEMISIGGRVRLLMQHYNLNMNKLSIRLKVP